MKKYLTIASCILLCGGVAEGQPVYDEEIEPYVAFVEQGHPEPIDYVMDLFDRYDVVVLCERFHPEAFFVLAALISAGRSVHSIIV